ncbi:MAG: ribulose-phosphate 3-epimerase [Caldilineales bacterium]
MPPLIAPSILAADFLHLADDVQAAERGGAQRFQLDVMDGVFVPNISFGLPLLEAMRRASSTLLEAHLMIVQPERYVEQFAAAGADLIIIHQEAVTHLDRAIHQIKQTGKRAGVAICPATPIQVLDEVIELLDMALVMTVNPGFGGQRFIPYTLEKIRRLRAVLDARNPACELEVDGGIDLHTIGAAYAAGARVFVAGSAVFGYAGGAAAALPALVAAAQQKAT